MQFVNHNELDARERQKAKSYTLLKEYFSSGGINYDEK